MTNNKALPLLLKEWKEYPDQSMRLGQYFMNFYLTGSQWTELFYTEDTKTALTLIAEWLDRHQYYDELPEKPTNYPKTTD